MTTHWAVESSRLPPLEQFVRDYAETAGGAWEEIEPQVYDLLIPGERAGVARIAFDPEALPEHPEARLASFGAPFVDRMLSDAMTTGGASDQYVTGLNLRPHDLPARLSRALTLADGLSLEIVAVRLLSFPQAVFWFEASFVSGEQKEQEILTAGIDLHYSRQVRHLDQLMNPAHLAASPAEPLPPARHCGLREGYLTARERVARTAGSLANSRRRELAARTDKQAARMIHYYEQFRREMDQQAQRAGVDQVKHAARVEALRREEQLRVTEIRGKASLKVHVRLLSLLRVHQPKLLCTVEIKSAAGRSGTIDTVWDPLVQMVEAVSCPRCGQPTFNLALDRTGAVVCARCANNGSSARR